MPHGAWAEVLVYAGAAALAVAAWIDGWLRTNPARFVGAVAPDQRFFQCRPDKLAILIRNSGPRPLFLRAGLAADARLGVHDPIRTVTLPAGSETRLEFDVTPVDRGKALVSDIYFEADMPWRLMRARWKATVGARVTVYPDIGRMAAALYSSRMLRSVSGPRRANLAGKGREFDQLRDYVPGDPYQDIHWKATARLDRPVTKLYRIERTQTIYAAVDTSRLGRVRHGDKSSLDYVAETALHLAIRCEREGDLFGLIDFSDRVNGFVPAARGTAHLKRLRERVSGLEASAVTPAYEELMVFIRRMVRRRSFLIFFTDLSDPAHGAIFRQNLRVLGPKHLCAAIHFRPAWARPLFEEAPAGDAREIYARLAGQMGLTQIDRIRRDLKQLGVDLLVTDPSRICADTLNAYLRVKERQLI